MRPWDQAQAEAEHEEVATRDREQLVNPRRRVRSRRVRSRRRIRRRIRRIIRRRGAEEAIGREEGRERHAKRLQDARQAVGEGPLVEAQKPAARPPPVRRLRLDEVPEARRRPHRPEGPFRRGFCLGPPMRRRFRGLLLHLVVVILVVVVVILVVAFAFERAGASPSVPSATEESRCGSAAVPQSPDCVVEGSAQARIVWSKVQGIQEGPRRCSCISARAHV